jgi:hypothetical protein
MDQNDAFIESTQLWVHGLRERCKEDETFELSCVTARGTMRVHAISLLKDGVIALLSGDDWNGNFVERLSYSGSLDLTANIVQKVDATHTIGFKIEREA